MVESRRKQKKTQKKLLKLALYLEIAALCFVMFMIGYVLGGGYV